MFIVFFVFFSTINGYWWEEWSENENEKDGRWEKEIEANETWETCK